jgi:hypothetical protein
MLGINALDDEAGERAHQQRGNHITGQDAAGHRLIHLQLRHQVEWQSRHQHIERHAEQEVGCAGQREAGRPQAGFGGIHHAMVTTRY